MRSVIIATSIAASVGVVPPSAAAPVEAPCLSPVVGDRCERWSFTRDRGYAVGVASHPIADLTFSAATTWGADAASSSLLLSAVDGSGAEVWARTFTGSDEGYSEALSLAVDEDRACVAGWIGTGTGAIPSGYAVGVACYEPTTGAPLWERIMHTPQGRLRGASAIAIAEVPLEADGEIVHRDVVFVTGTDEAAPFAGEVSDKNILTQAFDAADGSELWTAVYDGPSGKWDAARMIDVSTDGRRVFVGGVVTNDYWRYGVVAYDATTGQQAWAADHTFPASGRNGWKEDWPMDMALAPDGATLAVTGRTIGERGGRFGTVAFAAEDGSVRWSAIHAGDAGPDEVPDTIAVPPVGPFATVTVKGSTEQGNALAFAGQRLYVTGTSRGFPMGPAYTTVAYDAAGGEEAWSARYDGPAPGIDAANAIAVSPSGSRIYVTGRSSRAPVRFTGSPGDAWRLGDDIATVAYDKDGNELWVARFDGANDIDIGHAITTDGSSVQVAGRSLSQEDPLSAFASADLLVLSYDA